MRKPEHRIYRHVMDVLQVHAHECVFVDDLPVNVSAAVEVAMVGVVHRCFEQTVGELEALLDLSLG